MAKKPKTLGTVRPNQGIAAAYNARLQREIDEMSASFLYWIRAAYRANEPEMATDASPARDLQAAVSKLGRRWQRKFDRLAVELAAHFAKTAADRSDRALRAMLKRANFTVEFRLTAAQNDVLQATVAENVQLIRSIPQQYLTSVQGDVMRSVAAGRNLSTLTRELEKVKGVTSRRAANIARDQNEKATAMLARVRQRELGITQAIWVHSGAGKHPRPEHVAMSGKPYDVEKGAYLEGKWTWPGVEINCRCTSRPIIPGLT